MSDIKRLGTYEFCRYEMEQMFFIFFNDSKSLDNSIAQGRIKSTLRTQANVQCTDLVSGPGRKGRTMNSTKRV